jgi:adenylate cyclase
VIGDNVNLASRLEGLTKHYQLNCVISERCFQLVESQVVCRVVDQVRVLGKEKPVTIYEPRCFRGEEGAESDERLQISFAEGWNLYRKGEFQLAAEKFRAIAAESKDGLSQVYVERCEGFMKNPPPSEWDGVYELSTK